MTTWSRRPKTAHRLLLLPCLLVLAASTRAGGTRTTGGLARSPLLDPRPLPETCSGGEFLDLLRNGSVTGLYPVAPGFRTIFDGLPCDPTLGVLRDLEVQGFASGAAFPHDASDLDPSLPLVFYQVTSPTRILKVAKTAGRVVVSYEMDAAQRITFPAPGGGAMIGGARSGVILMANGNVWNWGADFAGRLGQGNAVALDQYEPVEVHGPLDVGFLSDIKGIAAGEPFSIALASDGTIWGWGHNGFGELGIGDVVPASSSVPVQAVGVGGAGTCLPPIEMIAARGYHALAMDATGALYAWGMNGAGECGTGTTVTPQPTPVLVQGLPATRVQSITAAFEYNLALLTNGTVWGWGRNTAGQMGDGTFNTPVLVPERVGQALGFGLVKQISAGWAHAIALKFDGSVYTWGANGYGQIGDGTLNDASTPTIVPGPGGVGLLSSIVMVSGGDCHSMALRDDGTVWTWGCNHHNGFNPPPAGNDPVGQLGNGDNTYRDQPYPVQVVGGEQGGPFLQNIILVSARDYHNFALAADGTLYSWGSNLNGQLGNGTCCLPSTVPVRVHLP